MCILPPENGGRCNCLCHSSLCAKTGENRFTVCAHMRLIGGEFTHSPLSHEFGCVSHVEQPLVMSHTIMRHIQQEPPTDIRRWAIHVVRGVPTVF